VRERARVVRCGECLAPARPEDIRAAPYGLAVFCAYCASVSRLGGVDELARRGRAYELDLLDAASVFDPLGLFH
jgi:hypothetical protein